MRPRWVLDQKLAAPSLLTTRHQLLASEPLGVSNCTRRYNDRYCITEQAEILPYLAYKWTDGPPWLIDGKAVLASLTAPTASTKGTETQLINICFVGDSHARNMYASGKNRKDAENIATFSYIFSLFPPLFNITTLAEYHCSVAVLSYGIWSLNHSPYPHTERMHKAQMSALLKQLTAYRGPTRLFIRSENHNGLGSESIACPGKDRRSPPAFDMVNSVTKELCDHYKIPFIDLDPIIYPMWDSAYDYCHPPGHVFSAEVSYILHRVFKHTLAHQQVLTTYPISLVLQNLTNVPSYPAQDAEVAKLKALLEKGGRHAPYAE